MIYRQGYNRIHSLVLHWQNKRGLVNINSSPNISFQKSVYDNFFKRLPNKDIKNQAALNKAGHTLASPHWNRLAIGGAAILTQPFIDGHNPRVDKDTARASMLRTTGKIIACTSVGFVVRGACYKLTNKFMHATKAEGSTLLTPKAILNELDPKVRENMLKLHKNAFSTVSALGVMLFTNPLADAPLTTILSNKFLAIDSKRQHKEAHA